MFSAIKCYSEVSHKNENELRCLIAALKNSNNCSFFADQLAEHEWVGKNNCKLFMLNYEL